MKNRIATYNKRGRWRDSFIAAVAIISMAFLVVRHVQQNDSWKTLFADIKVAQQIEKIDAWKDYGARGYLINELGKVVSEANYLRAVWAQLALGFIYEMPLGYGLVYKSLVIFPAKSGQNLSYFKRIEPGLILP